MTFPRGETSASNIAFFFILFYIFFCYGFWGRRARPRCFSLRRAAAAELQTPGTVCPVPLLCAEVSQPDSKIPLRVSSSGSAFESWCFEALLKASPLSTFVLPSMGISREASSQSSCLEISSRGAFVLGLDFPKSAFLASDESQTAESSVALGCGVDRPGLAAW